jgi:hypothetical protein
LLVAKSWCTFCISCQNLKLATHFSFRIILLLSLFPGTLGEKSILQQWKDIKGSSISFLDYIDAKVFHPLFPVSLAHPVLLHTFSLILPVQLL